MLDSTQSKQKKQVSVFSQPLIQQQQKRKTLIIQEQKGEGKDNKIVNSQQQVTALDRLKQDNQFQKQNEPIKDSMRSSKKSKSFKGDLKNSIRRNQTNPQTTQPKQQVKMTEGFPIKEEQSESELNNSFNIEQEHSRIVLNEGLSRQASKKAFLVIQEPEIIQEQINDSDESKSISINMNNFIINETKNEQENENDQEAQSDQDEYDEQYYEINQNYSLELKVSHNLKWLRKEFFYYQDKLNLLFIRKALFLAITLFEIICCNLLKSTLFDLYEMFLTITNIFLFLHRGTGNYNQVNDYQSVLCSFYFINVIIHFAGQGFKYYFTSFWNIYDLIILILSFLFIVENQYMPFDVSTFRLIRIPFYVGRINNTVNIILMSIKEAVKQIVENLLILILFTVLIAIIMLYAFNGVLRYRCMEEELGIFELEEYEIGVCGYDSCPHGQICARQLENIEIPTNFDNVIFSYFQTIRTSILNEWTVTMYMLMKQFNPFVCLLYIFIIFAINKFYFQLLIAVLKVHYHKTQEYYIKHPIKPEFFEDQISVNLKVIQDLGIWKQIKQLINEYELKKKQNQHYFLSQNNNNNNDSPQNNQEKIKFLSARQQIDMINEKNQIVKQYTYDSWIIQLFYPNHDLQIKVKQLITMSETKINNLQIFYSLLSLDYLSLFISIKKLDTYNYSSLEDVITQKVQSNNLVNKIKINNKPKRNYEYIFEISNIVQLIKQKKSKFPIRKVKSSLIQTINIIQSEDMDEDDESYFSESEQPNFQQKQIQHQSIQKKTENEKFEIHLPNQQNLSKFYQSTQMTKSVLKQNQKDFEIYSDLINLELKEVQIEAENIVQLYNDKITLQEHELVYQNYWSGNDSIKNYQFQTVLSELNKGWQFQFNKGFIYYLTYLQFSLYHFITKPIVAVLFDALVCINILMLALSEFSEDSLINYFDLIISFALFLEMIIKSFTVKQYLSDIVHVLGLIIISFAAIERLLAITSEESLNYNNLAIIRILKSLFFFRVIKYNTFAQNMMMISYQTFPNYAVIALLLFFLILNYAVFSLQIFDFPDSNELALYHYFGNVYQSWMAIYNISTNDDWYAVVVLSTTYGNYYISFLFCISLVFVVNYFGFGLAFVVILDGFAHYLEVTQEIEEEIEQLEQQNENSQKLQLQQEGQNEQYDDQQRIMTSIEQKEKKDFNNTTLQNLLSSLIQPEDTQKYSAISNQFVFFIISKRNILRKICFKISENIIYQIIIGIILWGSLINMIVATYYLHEHVDSTFWTDFEIIKCLCNTVILIDALIKIIIYGVFSKESQFNSIWIIFDFIYVVCYFLYLITDHKVLKWILLLSYLRPLKVTSTFGFFINERGAIMKSLGDIIKIFYVILLFWFIFAIFGMAIYKDKLGYCDDYFNLGVGKHHCEGEWKVYPHNFDNIFEAMQALFVLATLDLWFVPLFVYINAASEETGPIRFNSEWITYIYLFSVTFIGGLFFIQFFAGVIFVNFFQNKLQLLNPDLTLDQELFLKLTEIIMLDTPNYAKPPKKGLRLKAKRLIENSIYTFITRTSLILNLIIIMLYFEDADNKFLHVINWIHHFLSLILFIDTILKLFTYHLKRYLDDVWRQMQLIFIIFALVDFFLDITYDIFIRYSRGGRDDPYFVWLRLFMLHRCLRLSLIIQQFTRVRKLLNVIYFNKMALLRILSLFFVVIQCYSYIGCELFHEYETGEFVNEQLNYKNFFYGLLTTFKVTQENGWRIIFLDYYEHMQEKDQGWIATIYFYTLIFVGAKVLMNLVVCELVQEFEKFYDTSSSCLETYVETIDKFRNLWCKYTEEYEGKKMQTKYLAHFLLDLGEPLGAQKGDNIWDAAKLASGFELKQDFINCLTFRNLLYEIIKYSFRESIFKISTDAGKKIMKNNDKRIKYRLYNQREHKVKRERVHQIVDLQSNFNVLQEYLYLYMALKAWKQFSKYFFSIAGDVQRTIDFTESDIDEQISKLEDLDENEDDYIEQQSINQIKNKKRRPSKEHLRRPTDVYILPYYDEIPSRDALNEKILKPTDVKQQNKLKSISVIKKKEQLIKYKDYNKRRDGIDKQIQLRNRYQYGYHEKMVIKQIYEEKSDNRLMSKIDPMKMPSGYNIAKIGSRLK